MNKIVVYIDGQFKKYSEKELEAFCPGVVSDLGVFETILIYHKVVIDFDLHWSRMVRGLNLYGLKFSLSYKKTLKIISDLIEKNDFDIARVRLAMWKEGEKKRMAIIAVGQEMLSEPQIQKGLKVAVSPLVRDRSKVSHIKSMDYGIFRKAFQLAVKKGCAEALLLNSKKYLVEGSRTNIFLVRNNKVFTPAIFCGCVNGITRQKIIKMIRKAGLIYEVGSWTLQDLFESDEAFLTNSVGGVFPLVKVDKVKIGNGKAGQVTLRLRKLYQDYLENSCL